MNTPPAPPPPLPRPAPSPAPPHILGPVGALHDLAGVLQATGLGNARVQSIVVLGGRPARVTICQDSWRDIGLIVERVQVRERYEVHATTVGPIEVCKIVATAPGAVVQLGCDA